MAGLEKSEDSMSLWCGLGFYGTSVICRLSPTSRSLFFFLLKSTKCSKTSFFFYLLFIFFFYSLPLPLKCHTNPSSSLLQAQLVLSVQIRFRYPSDPPRGVSRSSAALLATAFPPAELRSLQVSPRRAAHGTWPESPLALNHC